LNNPKENPDGITKPIKTEEPKREFLEQAQGPRLIKKAIQDKESSLTISLYLIEKEKSLNMSVL